MLISQKWNLFPTLPRPKKSVLGKKKPDRLPNSAEQWWFPMVESVQNHKQLDKPKPTAAPQKLSHETNPDLLPIILVG